MKRFEGPAAQHYWHSLNTWDRLRVCNKLCCTVLLRTELMCRDFTFQHHSGSGFSIKHSTVPMMLPKQVFTSYFVFCQWSVYLSSICHLRHLIINSISSQGWRLCDKCQESVTNKYHFCVLCMIMVFRVNGFRFRSLSGGVLADGATTWQLWGVHCHSVE